MSRTRQRVHSAMTAAMPTMPKTNCHGTSGVSACRRPTARLSRNVCPREHSVVTTISTSATATRPL